MSLHLCTRDWSTTWRRQETSYALFVSDQSRANASISVLLPAVRYQVIPAHRVRLLDAEPGCDGSAVVLYLAQMRGFRLARWTERLWKWSMATATRGSRTVYRNACVELGISGSPHSDVDARWRCRLNACADRTTKHPGSLLSHSLASIACDSHN